MNPSGHCCVIPNPNLELKCLPDTEEEFATAFPRSSVQFESVIEAQWNIFDFDAKPGTARFAQISSNVGECRKNVSDIHEADPLQETHNRKTYFVVKQE